MQRRGALAPLVPLLVVAGLACAAGASSLLAQDAAPYTLHVYTNLVQVPALVLNQDRKPRPPVQREQFAISLDHGAAFHPTHMRVEGDDPLSLAVLLDVSGGNDDIVASFANAFPLLAPQYLHPKDHVSIYALGCVLVRSVTDLPADSDALQAGIAAALADPVLRGTRPHVACGGSVRLWDAVVQLTNALGSLPGRRVLLIVSNGKDGKSTTSFSETNMNAISNSVAIFGMRNWIEFLEEKQAPGQIAMIPYTNGRTAGGSQATALGGGVRAESMFDLLCAGNGGFVQNLSQKEMAKSLQNFITLLRGRYILEFPRPDVDKPGMHSIEITVPGTADLVWAPGVSYAGPDPSVLADPSTVPVTPSPATFGTRRPVDPKQ
jgi:hypothetical protein